MNFKQVDIYQGRSHWTDLKKLLLKLKIRSPVISVTDKSRAVNGVEYKQCGKCKQFKPLMDLCKPSSRNFDVAGKCKDCVKQYDWECGEVGPKYQNTDSKSSNLWVPRNKQILIEDGY